MQPKMQEMALDHLHGLRHPKAGVHPPRKAVRTARSNPRQAGRNITNYRNHGNHNLNQHNHGNHNPNQHNHGNPNQRNHGNPNLNHPVNKAAGHQFLNTSRDKTKAGNLSLLLNSSSSSSSSKAVGARQRIKVGGSHSMEVRVDGNRDGI
jgi:hypothetical protein